MTKDKTVYVIYLTGAIEKFTSFANTWTSAFSMPAHARDVVIISAVKPTPDFLKAIGYPFSENNPLE